MQDETIIKFLDGNVSDQEFSRCETQFENISTDSINTVADAIAQSTGDPLMTALRTIAQFAPPESEESKRLTDRIERLVSEQVLGKNDLERILEPAMAPDELGRIAKYRITEFIAAGGMGLVFKAEDTELSRLVCIKVMHPSLAMKTDARIRFQRESKAAARLRSVRIVTVFDIGVQRDLPYIVMQLLDGETLRAKLSRVGNLSSEQAIHYLKQIAEGLRYAHAFGIVHRDIKPDNIWITPEDDIKILDFGLARELDDTTSLTTSGGLLGTPSYMSPEQIQGLTVDARSDLFSVGIVLYEMLTGKLPFHKNNLFSTMISIANDSVRMPSDASDLQIPSDLQSLLSDLLQKETEQRPQSADALIARLQRDESSSIHEITSISKPVLSPKLSQGNWGGYRVVAGVLLGAAATWLIMFLVDQNNKGTLVVRTNDPSVEIGIAKEKVSVKDPLTGRQYEIRIGETPLHRGLYQLEMTSANGDLRFSSSTIAIRRGERTIVDVELQPSDAVATESPSSRTTTIDSPKTIADPSYGRVEREQFSLLLPILRSIPTNELMVATYDASVSIAMPAPMKKLEGIDRWTITHAVPSVGVENCDRTLIARVSGQNLCVFDRKDEAKYVLPTTGPIVSVKFDTKHPNLIAHGVYHPQATEKSWIYVWRLDADKANLIYRFPVSDFSFAWDSGYRLAYRRKEQLAFMRLDLGKSFDVSGPGKEYLVGLSPSGRFIASQSSDSGQTATNVWDLHRGDFAFSVLNGTETTWASDLNRVTVRVQDAGEFEIWNLETKTKEQTIRLQPEASLRNFSADRILASAMEASFKRIAWITSKGELVIRNIETNRQTAIRLTENGNAERVSVANRAALESGSIRWETDGSLLVSASGMGQFRWMQTESEVHGILTPVEDTKSWDDASKPALQFASVYGSKADLPTLEWIDSKAKSGNSSKPAGNYPMLTNRPADTWLTRLELKRIGSSESTPPIAITSLASGGPTTRSSVESIVISISPDGGYCIEARLPSLPRPQGEKEWYLTSIAVPSKSMSLGIFSKSMNSGMPPIQESRKITWHPSCKYFMTLEPKSTRSNDPSDFRLFDTEQFQWQRLPYTELPKGDMLQILAYEDQFLLVTKSNGKASIQLWSFDPKTLQAKELPAANTFVDRYQAGSIFATKKALFLRYGVLVNAPSNAESIPHGRHLRIPNEPNGSEAVMGITVPAPNSLFFSSDGQFILQDSPIVTGVSRSGQGTSYSAQAGPKFITRWSDDAKDLEQDVALPASTFAKKLYVLESNYATNLQWHHDSNVAFWNYSGLLNFYDAEADKLLVQTISPADLTNPSSVLSTDYGWLVCGGTQLYFFDRSGRFFGRLVFDSDPIKNAPTNPRWILADGSTSSRCSQRGLYLSMLKGTDFHTIPLDEFEQKVTNDSLPTFDEVPFLKVSPVH